MARPKKNYDQLFNEFTRSELPKNEFLRQKLINPSCGSACRNTGDWEIRRLKLLSINNSLNHKSESPAYSDGANKGTTNQAPDTVNISSLASKLSNQIESMLQQSGANLPKSFSVDEIAKLTAALSQLQLVRQREKGIWAKLPPQSKDPVPTGQIALQHEEIKTPIYEVQMDENGKFKTSRPLLVGYEKSSSQDEMNSKSTLNLFTVQFKNPISGDFETVIPRPINE